jgi:hypothetical protein
MQVAEYVKFSLSDGYTWDLPSHDIRTPAASPSNPYAGTRLFSRYLIFEICFLAIMITTTNTTSITTATTAITVAAT